MPKKRNSLEAELRQSRDQLDGNAEEAVLLERFDALRQHLLAERAEHVARQLGDLIGLQHRQLQHLRGMAVLVVILGCRLNYLVPELHRLHRTTPDGVYEN